MLLFVSCGGGGENKQIPDVSRIQIPLMRLERFDQALDSLSETNALQKHRAWKLHYGAFYRDFVERVLQIGSVEGDHAIADVLAQIAASPDFDTLQAAVEKTFDAEREAALNEALQDVFKRVRLYLPEAEMPNRFVAFFSGFALQTILGEDYMGIGLDLFLGAESPFYPAIVNRFPRFLSRRFTPDHLIPTVTGAYVEEALLEPGPAGDRILDQMLYHGKKLYLLDLFLPHTPDSLKIGYTDKQLAWARHFESGVWNWFVSENLLYESDRSLQQRYFGEAPFTAGLGDRNESAPRLGMFIGWQLVRRYMERFPETSIAELLELDDAQAFLEAARYQIL